MSRSRELDAVDRLAPLRKRFSIPDGVLYFDGNSLGALPVTVAARVGAVVGSEWGVGLIRSWFDGPAWWEAPIRVGDAIAPIVGSAPGQIVVGESVSVQLFNLLTAGARLRPGRTKLVVDAGVFPTDRYIAGAVARLVGLDLVAVSMPEIPTTLAAAGNDVALVLASAVDYRSGELWDLPTTTRACHEHGAVVLWDLCHAAGAVPVGLDEHDVDLAVGCTYKYLSGGPGAPAFAYVAAQHQQALDLPLSGWHGHARPFAFESDFVPAPGIARARVGTPPILSMLALEEALTVFDDAPIDLVREKSLALGRFFFDCLDDVAADLGLTCITPRHDAHRGSHLALVHPRSEDMMDGLLRRGVICDLRPPDILRFGFNALHVSFEDVRRAVEAIAEAAAELR